MQDDARPKGLVEAIAFAIVMLAVALMPGNSYSLFSFLRVVVFFVAFYCALVAHRQGRKGWVWLLVGTALLYNPFIRVFLTRDVWWPINLATIILLFGAGNSLLQPRPKSGDDSRLGS